MFFTGKPALSLDHPRSGFKPPLTHSLTLPVDHLMLSLMRCEAETPSTIDRPCARGRCAGLGAFAHGDWLRGVPLTKTWCR